MFTFLLIIENTEERNKLEQLYIKYHKYMFFIANDILKNSYEAQDVVQTAIIKMVHYLHKIDEIEYRSPDAFEEYADILTLKYYQDLSDKEIADVLCISHENVRTRLSQAKVALKKL